MRAPLRRLFALLLAPALFGLGHAAAQAQTALPGDPPARVGRLSHVEGQVSLRAADQTDWSAAALNYPVSTGLALWTEPEARAEVSYGDGAIRLDHETAIAVERLDDSAFDLRLDQGSIQLSVRQLGPRERVSIATPEGRMEALAPGTYRIDAGTGETPAGVTVLDGKARFGDGEHAVEAVGGESAIVKEDGSLGTVAAIRRPFDDWALAREAEVKAATATARHVPRSMPGGEDLGRYGTWTETPEYGAVWYPAAVPVGWAPYRYGHWAWVPPWGWTWIDDAPWGFAPFHYGRWAHYDGRWCWVPGRYARIRPVYAPALVAFIGGSSFSIGISVGRAPAIGWVPLGPREVYYPYYRSSVTYVRNVNVVHVNRTVINDINVTRIKRGPPQRDAGAFVNRRAATVVPVEAMRQAEPVHRAAPQREIERADLQGARPTTNLTAVKPSRAARAGFETERNSERPTPDQAKPGRPVTGDPDRLPPAPAPRREAKATPDPAPQARPRPESVTRAAPKEEHRGPQAAQPPRPPMQGRAAPPPEATPRAVPDRRGNDRELNRREQDGREAPSRDKAAPSVRDQSPARREAQERDAPPQRPQVREPAAPTPRSEAIGRPTMPTMHGPGHDQGRRATPEPARPVAPDLSDRQRPERPTVQAPRAARIEPPARREQQRIERARPEAPRAEPPRMEQPRMERRAEPPRPQAQRQPERREAERREPERRAPPRQACPAGADCSR